MFYSLVIEPCYLFSHKSFFKNQNQIIKWSGLKRTYNLCVVKKAILEISGSHI